MTTIRSEHHRAVILRELHAERQSHLFHIDNPERALESAHIEIIRPDTLLTIYYISWKATPYEPKNTIQHHTFEFAGPKLRLITSE